MVIIEDFDGDPRGRDLDDDEGESRLEVPGYGGASDDNRTVLLQWQ